MKDIGRFIDSLEVQAKLMAFSLSREQQRKSQVRGTILRSEQFPNTDLGNSPENPNLIISVFHVCPRALWETTEC